MAEYSFPFPSVNGDRRYGASDWAGYFSMFLTNGVFPSGTRLQVLPGEGMAVLVSAGEAWINGYGYRNRTSLSLPVAMADGVLPRMDRVVIQWQRAERRIIAVIKTGTPGSSPTPPELVRNEDYYELGIAAITVAAGTAAITADCIADTRMDAGVCGLVSSLITPDTSGWWMMWEAAWNEWFGGIKGQLSEDAATHLYETKAEKPVLMTAALSVAGWLGSGPYTQTVTVEGILQDDKPKVDIIPTGDDDADRAMIEAWGLVSYISTADGTITAKCLDDVPTVDIYVQMEVIR